MEGHRKSESDFAEWFGRRIKLSGAGIDKGDVIGENKYKGLLGENKHTTKNSFSLSLDIINKSYREARMQFLEPIWRVDFDGKRKIICMDEQLFRRIMEDED